MKFPLRAIFRRKTVAATFLLVTPTLLSGCGSKDSEPQPQTPTSAAEHVVRFEVSATPAGAPTTPPRLVSLSYLTSGTPGQSLVPQGAGLTWSTELTKQANIAVVTLGADAEGAGRLTVRLSVDGRVVGEKFSTDAKPGGATDSRHVGITWTQATGVVQ